MNVYWNKLTKRLAQGHRGRSAFAPLYGCPKPKNPLMKCPAARQAKGFTCRGGVGVRVVRQVGVAKPGVGAAGLGLGVGDVVSLVHLQDGRQQLLVADPAAVQRLRPAAARHLEPQGHAQLTLGSRSAHARLTLGSRSAHARLTLGSRSAHARLTLGSRSAHARLTLGSRSAHARLTLGSRSAHARLTLGSRSAHAQLTLSSRSAHAQLTLARPLKNPSSPSTAQPSYLTPARSTFLPLLAQVKYYPLVYIANRDTHMLL